MAEFGMMDTFLSNISNPPDSEELAAEIVENIDAGLCFRQISASQGAASE